MESQINLCNNIRILGAAKIYEKGSIIVHAGDHLDNIYFLQKGEVKLTYLSAEGDEKIIFFICSGSFFGEAPFFYNQPSLLQMTATKKSSVIIFSKEVVHRLLSDNEWFKKILICSLAKKSLIVTDQLRGTLYENPLIRTKRLLYYLAQRYGKMTEEGIAIKITQEEIASIIGIHRITITRALKQMELNGIIKKIGKSTIILKGEHFV